MSERGRARGEVDIGGGGGWRRRRRGVKTRRDDILGDEGVRERTILKVLVEEVFGLLFEK